MGAFFFLRKNLRRVGGLSPTTVRRHDLGHADTWLVRGLVAWSGGSKEVGIVQFPFSRLAGNSERMAIRQGLPMAVRGEPVLRVVPTAGPAPTFCASCAASIDFGVVWRGGEVYCSVECSLGGNRPA